MGAKRTAEDVNNEIYSALDIIAEYRAMGVQFAADAPRPNGIISCFSRSRPGEDRKPSAWVNVNNGRYGDSYSGEKFSLWDFAVKYGGASSWQEARKSLAAKAGVSLSRGRPPERTEFLLDPIPWDEGHERLAGLWCSCIKKGTTLEAIKAAGGQVAHLCYRDSKTDEKKHGKYKVIALPCFGPALLNADPVAWVAWNISGTHIEIFRGQGVEPEKVKMKNCGPSHGAMMGMSGLHQLEADPAAIEVIWKTAGPTDMLALWGMIPPELREKHVVITNASGEAGDVPQHIAGALAGHRVCIVHDADRTGEKGAEKWLKALHNTAGSVKQIRLPYDVAEKGGRDLRDFVSEGHTFEELLAIETQTEAYTPKPGDSASGTGEDDRDRILITTDESVVVAEAIDALAMDDQVYQRAGKLVQVIAGKKQVIRSFQTSAAARIEELPLAKLRISLTKVAKFATETDTGEKPAHPPDWLPKGVFSAGEWPGIRHLNAIASFPILRADGTILQTAGYDEQSGVLYQPIETFPEIPEHPTKEQAKSAAESLLEVITDFPFDTNEKKSAWLAAVLTPLARFAFDGPSPLIFIDANTPGVGKGLLADTVSRIVTGTEFGRTIYTPDKAEMMKTITSIALSGEQLILFDNIVGQFGNPVLDAALTSTIWNSRLLSKNSIPKLPLAVSWFATGNNVIFGSDVTRRILHIRLDTKLARPEEREDFKHPQLLHWIRSQRPRLVVAALTILRGFFAAGRPKQELKNWGSFDGWSDVVRASIVWAGLTDPCDTRKELNKEHDLKSKLIRNLMRGWKTFDTQGKGRTIAEIFRVLDDETNQKIGAFEILRESVTQICQGRDGRPNQNKLSYLLRSIKKRVFENEFFDTTENINGSMAWTVRPASDLPQPTDSIVQQTLSYGDQRDTGDSHTDSQENEQIDNSNSISNLNLGNELEGCMEIPSIPGIPSDEDESADEDEVPYDAWA